MKDLPGKTIWIIGAGSGIGKALAAELSGRGAKLILSGRDKEKLMSARPDTEGMVIPMDVCRPESMAAAYAQILAAGRLDGVIYLAGIYEPSDIGALDMEKADKMIATNFTGAMHVVRLVLPRLLAQGAGQIALCASLAGYCGLPGGQPYSATKAALINFTESLRAECRGSGVDIRLIAPGFVRTPMTDKNTFSMPMLMEPAQAARAIALGLQGNRFEITFPGRFSLAMKLLRLLPYGIYFSVASLCARKR